MMFNLGCQLNWTWNQMKDRRWGKPGKVIWSGKMYPQCGQHLLVAELIKGGQSSLVFCLLFFTLTGKFIYSAAAAAAFAALLPWVQNPASLNFQHQLKTSGSPGILQTFAARLEPLEHPASRTEQLLDFLDFQEWDSHFLDGPRCVL